MERSVIVELLLNTLNYSHHFKFWASAPFLSQQLKLVGKFSVLVKNKQKKNWPFLLVPYKVTIFTSKPHKFKNWNFLKHCMVILSLSPLKLLDSSISWWSMVSYTMKPLYSLCLFYNKFYPINSFVCKNEYCLLPPDGAKICPSPTVTDATKAVLLILDWTFTHDVSFLAEFQTRCRFWCEWLLMALEGLVASVTCSSQLSFLKHVPTDVWKQ